jgi:5-methyltetrahydrofolate--homocysteine methyltransferase
MLVIGECINASNQAVAKAIADRDKEFIQGLTKAQADAGADFIDVNVGAGQGSPDKEIEGIEWVVETVQSVTDKPLTVDSDLPAIIEAALGKYKGETVMINSVTAEPDRLETIGALAAKSKALVVALAMGVEGIPESVELRLKACETIMARLTGMGMKAEQIYFDPLVLPISVDTKQGIVTLKTIEQIKARYPNANTVMGLSNISFGLPNRKTVNRSFLLMSAYAGLDAAILDPRDEKMMSLVRIGDMLTGKDALCKGYIKAYRQGKIVD